MPGSRLSSQLATHVGYYSTLEPSIHYRYTDKEGLPDELELQGYVE